MEKERNDEGQCKDVQEKRSIPGRNAKDITAKRFFRRPEIAADIFNACVFGGRQVARAEDMKEAPTELPSVAFTADGDLAASTRLNDIVHVCATYINKDISCTYMCLESQSSQDRTMVLRVQEHLLRRYLKQVDLGDFRNSNWRLDPVLGFLINLSDKPWMYPLEFGELFGELPAEYRPFIPQFRLAIIDPYTMDAKKRSLFYTEMNTVVNSFCFSDDPVRLPETLMNPPGYALSLEAANLLMAYKKIDIPVWGKKGRSEMCKGWELYKQGLRNQGFEKGIQQGMEKGITRMVGNLLAMKMPIEDIARASGLQPDEISRIQTQMK